MPNCTYRPTKGRRPHATPTAYTPAPISSLSTIVTTPIHGGCSPADAKQPIKPSQLAYGKRDQTSSSPNCMMRQARENQLADYLYFVGDYMLRIVSLFTLGVVGVPQMCIPSLNLYAGLHVCVSQGHRRGFAQMCIPSLNLHVDVNACVSQGRRRWFAQILPQF
jgi:hypothetical protein